MLERELQYLQQLAAANGTPDDGQTYITDQAYQEHLLTFNHGSHDSLPQKSSCPQIPTHGATLMSYHVVEERRGSQGSSAQTLIARPLGQIEEHSQKSGGHQRRVQSKVLNPESETTSVLYLASASSEGCIKSHAPRLSQDYCYTEDIVSKQSATQEEEQELELILEDNEYAFLKTSRHDETHTMRSSFYNKTQLLQTAMPPSDPCSFRQECMVQEEDEIENLSSNTTVKSSNNADLPLQQE